MLEGKNATEVFARLQQQHADWSDAVRGAVRDLTWGTLRDFGRGSAILHALLRKPLPPEVESVLLVALYRLDNRPEQAFSIVDQAVEAIASFAPGLRGVANAVLRNSLRQQAALAPRLAQDDEAVWRHPAWWVDRLRKAYPQGWQGILEAGNSHPPMAVRANRRYAEVAATQQCLIEAGLACRRLENDALLLDKPVPVSRLPDFAAGRLSVQDAGAQWAASWLDVADGQRVLDACAAPGGKTAHVLERAQVALLALEADKTRLARIHENLDRLNLSATVCHANARKVAQWWDGRHFDRILADVPCSASGVVRRNPDIKWLRRDDDIVTFVRQQAQILDALWQTLAPGGKMLYVTCSVFPEENGEQIDAFCARHDDAARLPIAGRQDRQWLPDADHDGFYYALLGKKPR